MNNDQIKNKLPPVEILFRESWDIFKKVFLKLFLLNLLGIVLCFVLIVAAALPFIISIISSFGQNKDFLPFAEMFNLPTSSYIIFAVSLFAVLLLLLVMNYAFQISYILIIDRKGETPIWKTFKESFSYIFPFLLAGLLQALMGTGAFFLFLIPGLIFYLFLMFTNYEVIMGNKRGAAALRSSVSIVMANFSGIFGRSLLLILVYIAINLLLPELMENAVSGARLSVVFLSFIINSLFGWFSLCYSVVLYKQAKAAFGDGKEKNITWMWIVSGLGWLIFIAIVFFAVKYMPMVWDLYSLNSRVKEENSYTLPQNNNTPDLDYYRTDEDMIYELPVN